MSLLRCSARASLRSAAAVLAIVSGLSGVVALAPAAQADTYRFWSYWHADNGSWTLAKSGSGNHQPAGGAVEGWRFAKSSGGAESSKAPRPEPSFERVCGSTQPVQGSKRVAVVIDYGTAKAAPDGGGQPPVQRAECAQVPEDANGNEVLAAVAAEQYADSGMVCSIDGYPQGACGSGSGSESGDKKATEDAGKRAGGNSSSPAPAPDAQAADDSAAASSNAGIPVGTIAGVAVGALLIGALAGAAILRMRKAR